MDSLDTLIASLEAKGYYRLRGFWLTLESEKRFLPGTSLSSILEIEQFNKELCLLIFAAIAPIEIYLRSQMASILANHYGSSAFHCALAFNNQKSYQQFQRVLKKETQQALYMEKPLVVYNMKKYGELPIWAEVENASFGTLSRAYGNLADPAVAREISDAFGVGRMHLKNWLRHLTQIRNICAHHDRLYNKMFTVRPRLFSEHKHLQAQRLFPTFIVLFHLHETLDHEQANLLRKQLGTIVDAHPSVDLAPIGFPENWREILRIPNPSARDIVRPRGRHGGRPLKRADSIEQALYLYDMREDTVTEIAKQCGMSLSTLYKYIHLRDDFSVGEGEGNKGELTTQ